MVLLSISIQCFKLDQWPLRSTSFPIHYPLIITSFDIMYSETVMTLLNKWSGCCTTCRSQCLPTILSISIQSHRCVQNQPCRINVRCLITSMNYFEPIIHAVVFKYFVFRSQRRSFPVTKEQQLCTLRVPASRSILFSPVDVELPPDSSRRAL